MRKFVSTAILLGAAINANATLVEGTFTGVVYGVSISAETPKDVGDFLVGDSVTGTFCYDTKYLVPIVPIELSSTSGEWQSTGAPAAAVLSATIDRRTYTVKGEASSSLYIDADESGRSNPGNRFYLSASANYGVGSRVARGVSTGSISIVVANNSLGSPYLSNITDPGTVSFTNQSLPASSGEGSAISIINRSGAGVAAINFAITDASAHAVSIDEPFIHMHCPREMREK
jgi:hypothetical protein